MQVFISYTLKDGLVTRAKLQKIKKQISEFATCYIDILDNDSLNKQQRVFDELLKSNLLLVLVSPDIKRSKWVMMENEFAETNNIPIIKIDVSMDVEDVTQAIKEYCKGAR